MLSLHRAERSDRLVDALAGLLAESHGDPFRAEVIAVPSRGVERWLAQRLSAFLGATPGREDGVCANVDFPFPSSLVGDALAAATGIDASVDPWLPDRSVWPLLGTVDDSLDEEWLGALAAHLGRSAGRPGDPRGGRRFAAVRHLADLFDRYGVHRPGMIRAWARGADTDGRGRPLALDLAWQAALWRRLRARIGVPSPAERMAEACRRVREDPARLPLPDRISLFGLTRLPTSYLDVLMAIAAARDVHLWLLHPSPVLWDRLAALAARPGPGPGDVLVSRRHDPTAVLPANPLLATWGRDAREMQLVLTANTEIGWDEHLDLGDDVPTLLGRIQADVRSDRPAPGAPRPDGPDARPRLAPEDRSVQVHACHGRARQVEVLRDAILHLLAEDPTLEPRHVIVMCPDIDAFAPLIHATFGLGRPDDGAGPAAGDGRGGGEPGEAVVPPGHELRVRLADRSIRQTNPVLGAVSQLLALASSRVTASQVIDFAGTAPVRRRFGFDDADLVRINEWVAAAGIRWGLDGDHRASWLLPGIEAGTWQSGLRRVLLGVTMSEDDQRLVSGVLPIDDVDSGDIDLAGRFAEFVSRLAAAVAALTRSQPVGAWVGAIRTSADALVATSDRDEWQRLQLQTLLDDLTSESGASVRLSLAEVQSLLADRLRGRPTRASFRTGHLTMCTLVPMRSVPHRVVCLLGLDDGVFPRRTAPDGDDLLERDPWVGDRDARSEDRQLLLDAVLAAEDHLVITYTGRDERTNALRPPAVPLGELLDVVDRTVRTDELDAAGTPVPARRMITTDHPLQPFDGRNFTSGTFIPHHPWSFDTTALDGAVAASAPSRTSRPRFLDQPLPSSCSPTIEIDDVVRFVQHPVKAFLRQRLGVVLRDGDDEPSDGLPVELDALERWAVGSRLLDGLLGGADEATCLGAEQARGTLPPGGLGQRVLDDVMPMLRRLVAAAGAETGLGDVSSIEVNIDLGAGRALVGTIRGVTGETIRAVSFSRLGAKQRLTGWVRVLALTAAHPERPWRAVTIGRGMGQRPMTAAAGPLGDTLSQRREVALAELRALIDLHDRGLREPLPLYCATSAAWAAARATGGDPREEAVKAWKTEPRDFPREDLDPAHRLVLGGRAGFNRIAVLPPGPDECGPGWADDESGRFGRLARRLWDPVLTYEVVDK